MNTTKSESKSTINFPLLRKIQNAISEKPLRFTMDAWLDTDDVFSPCGTAGCIAGHAVLLNDTLLPSAKENPKGWVARADLAVKLDVQSLGQACLGLTLGQANRLFFTSHWPAQFIHKFDTACIKQRNRRAAQAKVAVERIEHFIKTEGRE